MAISALLWLRIFSIVHDADVPGRLHCTQGACLIEMGMVLPQVLPLSNRTIVI